MKQAQLCEIISIDEIASGIYDVWIRSEAIARETQPGQFLHIDCGDGINTFLRRPISICDAVEDRVRFLFEVKGSGTEALARKKAGDTLDIIGPVGNSFAVSSDFKRPLVVGGGIGVFPLYLLSKQLHGAEVFLGFRSRDRVVMEKDFTEIAAQCHIATDDGSYGYAGYAVTLAEEKLKRGEGDILYACGPMPMLRAAKALAERYGVKCQLSLEQRMGCGIGACLVCTCETTSKGMNRYKRVCKNGPVFWSDEVTLND